MKWPWAREQAKPDHWRQAKPVSVRLDGQQDSRGRRHEASNHRDVGDYRVEIDLGPCGDRNDVFHPVYRQQHMSHILVGRYARPPAIARQFSGLPPRRAEMRRAEKRLMMEAPSR